MKRLTWRLLAFVLVISTISLTGCSSQPEDPGPPPAEVINPDNESASPSENDGEDEAGHTGGILEHAVTVRIGQGQSDDWVVDMYDNDAAVTMLDYLSGSPLLFPTYTYEEEQGFVAQNVRGSYSRDDEVTVADVKTGELYLFSGGQLRFYFKDMAGANITATPVGYYTKTEGLTEAVQEAYESNRGDVWGVDVYFLITKTLN